MGNNDLGKLIEREARLQEEIAKLQARKATLNIEAIAASLKDLQPLPGRYVVVVTDDEVTVEKLDAKGPALARPVARASGSRAKLYWELRQAGKTYSEIARECGIKSVGAVGAGIKAYQKKLDAQGA